MRPIFRSILPGVFGAALLLAGCGGGGGNGGGDETDTNASTIAAAEVIPPGAQCASGGIRVDSGIDDNGNGVLDANEVDDSQVLCNGNDGNDSLIARSDEPAGANCEFGGTRIDGGTDANDNGTLDAPEISATEYLCAASGDSFDGLVYLADANVDDTSELFSTGKDSARVRRLIAPRTTQGYIGWFTISPDRTHVAIQGDLEGGGVGFGGVAGLYVASLVSDTPALRVSLPFDGPVDFFEWSPDGRWLTYYTRPDFGPAQNHVVAVDGTGNRTLYDRFLPLETRLDGVGSAWAPEGSRLAYSVSLTSLTERTVELYTLAPNAAAAVLIESVSVPIADFDQHYIEFRWAPGSRRLAYTVHSESFTVPQGTAELRTVTADGTANTLVTRETVEPGEIPRVSFEWAPDGSRLAYIESLRVPATPQTVASLHTVAEDGTNLADIYEPPFLAQVEQVFVNYEWSPDSARIAYTVSRDTAADKTVQVYTVLANGTGNTRVNTVTVTPTRFVFVDLEWAPDSGRLAYEVAISGPGGSESSELFTVAPGGTGNTSIVRVTGINDWIDGEWAPDGSRLTYYAETSTAVGLHSVTPDGSARTAIYEAARAPNAYAFIRFKWAPDSSRLAYHVERQTTATVFELFTVGPGAAGGTLVYTATVPINTFPWTGFEWSPDSTRLAYVAPRGNTGASELYTAAADGTGPVKVSGPLVEGGSVGAFDWEFDDGEEF